MDFNLVFIEPNNFDLTFGVSGFQAVWAVNSNVIMGA